MADAKKQRASTPRPDAKPWDPKIPGVAAQAVTFSTGSQGYLLRGTVVTDEGIATFMGNVIVQGTKPPKTAAK